MNRRAWVAGSVFLVGIVAANMATARLGFVPVGFGLVATAGTYAAGVCLVARDYLQDAAGWRGVAAFLAVGVVLSWVLSTPALAVASAAAFAVSESLDAAVYTPLRDRSWRAAVVASSLVGAVVDTVVFLGLAFGVQALTLPALAGQLVGKVLWVAVPVALIGGVIRAVPVRVTE